MEKRPPSKIYYRALGQLKGSPDCLAHYSYCLWATTGSLDSAKEEHFRVERIIQKKMPFVEISVG